MGHADCIFAVRFGMNYICNSRKKVGKMESERCKSSACRMKAAVRKLLRECIVFISVVAWFATSNALVLLNRYIMVELDLKTPTLLASFGQFSTLVFLSTVFAATPKNQRLGVEAEFFAYRILPIGLFSCGTLAFGQYPYYTLSVSYIQMLKSLTPVITLVCMLLFGVEHFRWSLILSVCVIAGGTCLASVGEVSFDWTGTIYMITSELSEALKLVATQILLQGSQYNSTQGLLLVTVASLPFLAVFSLATERHLYWDNALPIVASKPWHFLAAGVLGVGINVSSMIIVKLLSGLWLKILAQAKSALLVIIGVMFLGDTITHIQVCGYITCLIGLFVHTALKARAK